MDRLARIGLSALVTGSVASVVSTAALALLAKAEGKGAAQPTNSTSHWLHGEEAAYRRRPDLEHTLVGYGTHHASTLFWALPFQMWLEARPPRTTLALLRDAAAMSAVAAAVDYGVTPKRLTPGWEHVLSTRSMAAAFGAVALGLASGALIAQHLIGSDDRFPRTRDR